MGSAMTNRLTSRGTTCSTITDGEREYNSLGNTQKNLSSSDSQISDNLFLHIKKELNRDGSVIKRRQC